MKMDNYLKIQQILKIDNYEVVNACMMDKFTINKTQPSNNGQLAVPSTLVIIIAS